WKHPHCGGSGYGNRWSQTPEKRLTIGGTRYQSRPESSPPQGEQPKRNFLCEKRQCTLMGRRLRSPAIPCALENACSPSKTWFGMASHVFHPHASLPYSS